jgi:hypothetical protein
MCVCEAQIKIKRRNMWGTLNVHGSMLIYREQTVHGRKRENMSLKFENNLWTHKYITLLVFWSHVTPLQLHGSVSSGLHKGRIPSELTIALLKLNSASPTKTQKWISKFQCIMTGLKHASPIVTNKQNKGKMILEYKQFVCTSIHVGKKHLLHTTNRRTWWLIW